MVSFLKKSKNYLLIALMMFVFGALFLTVYFTYDPVDEDVRNSTDNIAKKIKLAETSFTSDKLPTNWKKSDDLLIMNEVALFDESELMIETPLLNRAYTKYFEINISEVNNPLDGQFLIRGYTNNKSTLLEEISINVHEVGLIAHRFSYDYIFIDQIEFLYIGQETSLSVAYIGVFSLE